MSELYADQLERHVTKPPVTLDWLAEFAKSTANAAVVDPLRAVAQINDHVSNSHYDLQIKSAADNFGLKPSTPAEFGTAAYFGQQLGNAVGMMVPFMLLKGCGGKLAGTVCERKALASAVEQSHMQTPSLLRCAGSAAMSSGVTGFAYGSFLRPTDDQSSKHDFWEERLHQGLSDMATFGILGFTSPYVSKGLDSAARVLERPGSAQLSALMDGTVPYHLMPPNRPTVLASLLRSPVVGGAFSSVPAGLLNAESQARSDGRWLPNATELKENLATMIFVGGAFGAAHSLENACRKEKFEYRIDTKQPDTKQFDTKQPDTKQPDTKHPDTKQPDLSEPQVETSAIATKLFRDFIDKQSWSQAYEILKSGGVDPSALKDKSMIRTMCAHFDQAMQARSPNWSELAEMLRLNVIPPEHYSSPLNKMVALRRLVMLVGERMHHEIAPLLETKILTDADLKNSENLRRMTKVMLESNFLSRSYEQFKDYTWVDRDLLRDGLLQHLRSEMRGALDIGKIQGLFEKGKDLDLLSDQEAQKLGQEALMQRVASDSWGFLEQYGRYFYGDDWAQESNLRAAALKRVMRELPGASNLDLVVSALKYGLVSSDILQTKDAKLLALTGFNKRFTEGANTASIQSFHQQVTSLFGEISPDDYRSAAVERLSRAFADVSKLDDYLDMSRDTLKINYTSDELRAAARDELIRQMSQNGSGVKDIIDRNILTAAEVKDAAATAIPISIAYHDNLPNYLAKAYEVDDARLRSALKMYVAPGRMTDVLRTAQMFGMDIHEALRDYAGISKLTDKSARELFEQLKLEEHIWTDQANSADSFESGAMEFGEARMLRYSVNPRTSPHDALLDFDHVLALFRKSSMTPEAFDGKILSQVSRDATIDERGTAYNHLGAIAKSFPNNAEEILTQARESAPELRQLAASFDETKYGAFADWNTLKRFGKLQHLLEQRETFEQLEQLEKNGQTELAAWLRTLLFHPDSRIPLDPVMKFWNQPEKFLQLDDNNTGHVHGLKKPSNYTDIPHLDLTAEQLRNALIDGTLDKIQVFNPMRVEYEVAPAIDIGREFDLALGSRGEQRKGTAKNVQRLFSQVSRLLKIESPQFTINDLVVGKEPPANVREKLLDLLYNSDIGVQKNDAKLRLIAEIHRKSDPIAVLAGDDTVSCMGFGSGKNNIYMYNPNDAQFTVRIVNQEGKIRTFAQSVLTKDKDIKESVPKLIESMHSLDAAQMHTTLAADSLRNEPAIIAADNIEVHPKYTGFEYQSALKAVYRDFFKQYLKEFGDAQNLRKDKIVIGIGYTDALNGLPQERNTYVPQAPVAYSDKTHETVYRLDMQPQKSKTDLKVEWIATPTKVEISAKPSVPQHSSSIRGVEPLTFEDTLPVAWLEGKAYQDNPSMIEGLHNLENSLIAQAINNAAKNRPNLSMKYTKADGTTQGYLLAYEGKIQDGEREKSVLFASDFSTDRVIDSEGKPTPGRAGGKLLQGFVEAYKRDYLDKGNFIPVLANAREETSYNLLQKNLDKLGKRAGYKFDVQELGCHLSGSSVMHDVLIVPQVSP